MLPGMRTATNRGSRRRLGVMERLFLVGPGNVGTRLAAALAAAGVRVETVTRRCGWDRATDAGDPAPRLLAMREDDLPPALERFPPELRPRLALVQNGFLEPLLGPLDETTRGLIWFTARGEFFAPLRPSILHGALAGPLAAALVRGGLAFEVSASREAFVREMIVKGAWNGVVGLPLAVHGLDLGTYLESHEQEWRAVISETTAAAGAWYGVPVDAETACRCLVETTAPIRHVAVTSAKALRWRNGAVVAMGRATGVPTPVNEHLLRAAGYDSATGGR